MKNYLKGIILASTFAVATVGAYLLGQASIKEAKQNEITVLAEDTDPVVGEGIVNHTLALSDTIYLGYYVHDSISLNAGEEIKVYVWNNEIDAKNTLEPDYICDFYQNVTSESGTTYGLYLLKGLGYKNLVDVMYAREVVTSQGRVIRSAEDIDDYSMLDYCANHWNDDHLAYIGSDFTLGDLMYSIANYAGDCQKYFGYRTNFLADEYLFAPRGAIASTTFNGKAMYFDSVERMSLVLNDEKYINSSFNISFVEIIRGGNLKLIQHPNNTLRIEFIEGSVLTSTEIYSSNNHASTTIINNVTFNSFKMNSSCNDGTTGFYNCIFDGQVEIEALADVVLEGCTFTKNSSIDIKNNRSAYFVNCIFGENESNYIDCYFSNVTELFFNKCKFYGTNMKSTYSKNIFTIVIMIINQNEAASNLNLSIEGCQYIHDLDVLIDHEEWLKSYNTVD